MAAVPMAPWVPWVIRAAALGWAVYDSYFADDDIDERAVDELPEWRRIIFESHAGDDDFQWSLDVLNITDGAPDDSWTVGDFTDLESHLDDFIYAVKQLNHTDWTFTGIRYYRMKFAPIGSGRKFALTGGPVRLHPMSPITGSGGVINVQRAPNQQCLTVTEKTPLRRHWGRMYLPNTFNGLLENDGQYKATALSDLADAVQAFFDDLAGDDFRVVVPMTQLDKVETRALLSVTSIQVDSIPDVQRRRRTHTTLRKATRPT